MKTRFHKRSALLALSLLLIGLSLTCFLWVRKEQRQYRLNQQLIAALKKGDTKWSLTLVAAGADPNTWLDLVPNPTFSELMSRLLPHSSPPHHVSCTTFMFACGAPWHDPNDSNDIFYGLKSSHVPLMRAMILHNANVNAKNAQGWTPLHDAVNCSYQDNIQLQNDIKVAIKLLLAHGADPDSVAEYEITPISIAKTYNRHDIVDLLCKYSKRH